MNLTKEEYQKLVEIKSPPSPLLKNVTLAFCSGGLICALGQAISNFTATFGLSTRDCATVTGIALIFLSAAFTLTGTYGTIAKYTGAGTAVPITGFANSVVSPAIEFKSEGFIMGMATKMFIVAGPVLVYGISASILYGLIYALFIVK